MTARLGKLLRLALGSDRPGEAAAAIAALNRELRAAGSDYHALAAIVERASLVPQQTPPPPDDSDDDDDEDIADDWRTMRDFCLKHRGQLRGRELAFLNSLKKWSGNVTPKQRDWLTAIYDRVKY